MCLTLSQQPRWVCYWMRILHQTRHNPRGWCISLDGYWLRWVIHLEHWVTRQYILDSAHWCHLLMAPIPWDILLEQTHWSNHTGLAGIKGDRKFSKPFKRLKPSFSRGSGMSTIVLTLAGSGFKRPWLMTTPMYMIEVFLSWNLWQLNFTPYWMAHSSTLSIILPCSCSSAAVISMSPVIVWPASISPNTW